MEKPTVTDVATATAIWVVPSLAPRSIDGEKSLRGTVGAAVSLNVDVLTDNLQRFLTSINALLTHVPPDPGAFRLEEIQLVVEVSAEGGFQLIGGAKAGAAGGLTITLKRAS